MKSKVGLLVLFFLLGIGTKAQEHFYYYKGEKIPLTLNKQRVSFRASIDFEKSSLVKMNLKELAFFEDEGKSKPIFLTVETQEQKYKEQLNSLGDIKSITGIFPSYVSREGKIVDMTDYMYVKLKGEEDYSVLVKISKEENLEILEKNKFMPLWYTLKLTKNTIGNTLEISNRLYERGLFEAVEADFISNDEMCTNDPDFNTQWALKNTGQNGGTVGVDINACDAWTISKGENVVVAVLDSGIQLNHPDLATNIYPLSYNTETDTSPSLTFSDHGSHCAGIVGAVQDNNTGVSGIAPKSKLMSVSNSLAGAPNSRMKRANGINWAWQNGADIITNSWGSGVMYSVIDDAITNAITNGRAGKGCVVLFASGNASGSVGYPANSNQKILAIGALNNKGIRAGFSNYGSELDLVAPGVDILSTVLNSNYASFDGTSMATPYVAGVAALVLSVNPNLTEEQVRNVVESTAKKVSSNSYTYGTHTGRINGTWNNQMGYGLVDAYAAVQKAKQMMKPDLHIRDFVLDFGQEPNNGILGWFIQHKYWNSLDIWNRRSNDNGTAHQNVHYLNYFQNYINIRIKNRGDAPSTAQDSVRVHWAKAGTNLSWPMHWDGGLSYNNTPLGGIVATKAIPVLQPGESTVVKIPWSSVPNPNKYGAIFENSESFSLLARVISEEDPMTFTEGFNLLTNVKNNNNIAWKNTTVLGLRRYYPVPIGDVILVGNPVAVLKKYDLIFKLDDEDEGKPIYQESEVTVKLDPILYQAWVRGGKQSFNLKQSAVSQELIVMGDEAALKNLIFEAEEIGALGVEFNFLTKEITEKESHLYHIYQKDIVENELVGGSSFLIEKTDREMFFANSGGDKEVGIGESVVLQANEIGESATYNWYDSEGELVHVGKDYEMSVQENKDLVLEVIADSDGYKDYDEMSLKLKPNAIEVITPNPASTLVDVYYTINNNEASYYLKIVSLYGGTSFDTVVYPLIVDEDKVTIDVTAFGLGMYKVMMYCEGELVDAKNLIIE